MKRIKVIARESTISARTGKACNDAELIVLDGYYENIFQVDETYDETMFVLELEEKHSELKGRIFEIVELEKSE